MELEDKNVTSVFSGLGSYDIKKWRLFVYGDGDNLEYSQFTEIEKGRGYWLIIRERVDINPGSGTPIKATSDAPFIMELNSGWNLIGNPYNFRISWNDILNHNNQPNGIGKLKTFANGTLSENDVLERYRGAFVFSAASTATTIEIPPIRNASLGGRIGEIEQNTDLAADYWELQLNLNRDDFRNEVGGIGMHPAAAIKGKDKYDEVAVPVLAHMGFFEIGFEHPEYNTIFNKEFVPTADQYTWEFEVIRENNIPINLSWDNLHLGNNNNQLYLFNPSNLQAVNMREQNEYAVSSSTNHLKIIFGKQAYINTQLGSTSHLIGEPYPNPTSGNITLPFTVPQSNEELSRVTYKIYDNTGKLVTSHSADYETGIHQINWQFEHAGLYVIQLQLDGTTTSKKIIVK